MLFHIQTFQQQGKIVVKCVIIMNPTNNHYFYSLLVAILQEFSGLKPYYVTAILTHMTTI